MTATLDSFGAELRRAGLSPRTAALYRRTIVRLERDAEALGTDLLTAGVDELDELVDAWPRTRSSRQAVRSALARYWEAAGRHDPPLGALRVPRKARPRCRALSPTDARRLRCAAAERGDLPGLAVLLGLYCGLRRAEIAGLRWTDFDAGTFETVTVVGKGDRTRRVLVHDTVKAALRCARRSGPHLFPGAGGAGHAHPATIWGYVRAVGADVGIPDLATHELRHTCLATMLDGCRDLGAVQDFAGHASPETTRIYTRTSDARARAAVAALDDL